MNILLENLADNIIREILNEGFMYKDNTLEGFANYIKMPVDEAAILRNVFCASLHLVYQDEFHSTLPIREEDIKFVVLYNTKKIFVPHLLGAAFDAGIDCALVAPLMKPKKNGESFVVLGSQLLVRNYVYTKNIHYGKNIGFRKYYFSLNDSSGRALDKQTGHVTDHIGKKDFEDIVKEEMRAGNVKSSYPIVSSDPDAKPTFNLMAKKFKLNAKDVRLIK